MQLITFHLLWCTGLAFVGSDFIFGTGHKNNNEGNCSLGKPVLCNWWISTILTFLDTIFAVFRLKQTDQFDNFELLKIFDFIILWLPFMLGGIQLN